MPLLSASSKPLLALMRLSVTVLEELWPWRNASISSMVLICMTRFSIHNWYSSTMRGGPELITPPDPEPSSSSQSSIGNHEAYAFGWNLIPVLICWRVTVTVWPGLTAAPCARPYRMFSCIALPPRNRSATPTLRSFSRKGKPTKKLLNTVSTRTACKLLASISFRRGSFAIVSLHLDEYRSVGYPRQFFFFTLAFF